MEKIPTKKLRFKKRRIPSEETIKILQQKLNYKQEDVPTVKEE